MNYIKAYFIIFLSLFVGILLSLLPLPLWLEGLQPAWVALILCFWFLHTDGLINLVFAWFFGLLLDVIAGTALGVHALALSLLGFIVIKLQRQAHVLPLWQQLIIILSALIIYHVVLFALQWGTGYHIMDWRYWLTPFVGIVIWPWLCWILNRLSYRFSME